MVVVCEYCTSEFSSKRSLLNHLKFARYCQEKRLRFSIITCICNQRFADESCLKQHQTQCVAFDLSNQLEIANNKIEALQAENQRLQEDLKINSDRLFNIVEKAALSSKKSTTNNQYNLAFPLDLTPENIMEKTKSLNWKILIKGQREIANFFIDHIATNEKGDIGLICSNHEHKMFKYLGDNGELVHDPKARNLIVNFKEHSKINLNKTVQELFQEYSDEQDGEERDDKYGLYMKISKEVQRLGEGPFLDQLASRTYKINANGMLEFVPPPIRKAPRPKVIDAIPETQYEEWLERMN